MRRSLRRREMYTTPIFEKITRKIIRIVTRIYFLAIIFALLLLSLFFYDFRRFKETTNGRSERIPENALNGLPKWDKNVLININNFQFIAIPRVCYREQPLHVLAFVVSAPRNFEIRQAIRTTWGRNHPAVETLFALGITNNSTLQKLINNEYLKYGDIVQGNFIDSYRNLTYKTSMCLKYAVYFCQNAKYYIKTDDDVYVNIEHILGFIKELEGAETRKNSIYCKTIADAKPERSHSKWSVTRDEYFHDVYPTYCQGWAVIFDFYTIYQLYQAVQIMRFFWVEDVHITGTVRSVLSIPVTNIVNTYLLYDAAIDNFIKSDGNGNEIIFFVYARSPGRFHQIHQTVQNRRKTNAISFLEKLNIV